MARISNSTKSAKGTQEVPKPMPKTIEAVPFALAPIAPALRVAAAETHAGIYGKSENEANGTCHSTMLTSGEYS